MKKRPEKLGQELFGVFARTKLSARGCAIGEAKSGIGFVDMLVTFSSGLVHVIEFKMLKGGYSGEGEHRFRREAERRSGAKVNSSRSEATLA